MEGLPRNNLAEQLAIFRANNSTKPLQTPQTGGRRPAFSFHKVRSGPVKDAASTPFKPPGSTLQFRSNAAVKSNTCSLVEPPRNTDTGSKRWFQNSPAPSTDSGAIIRGPGGASGGVGQRAHLCTVTPGNNISPPIAMVAPVISSAAQTKSEERKQRNTKEVHSRLLPPPTTTPLPSPTTSLPLPTPTSTTLPLPTPTTPLPLPTPTSTLPQGKLEAELREVHTQRVAVMDTVCELLSDIPAAQINTMFGVTADHIQRKLAVRKQLLSKEEDIKRRLSSHAIPYLPHTSTLSPLSHPPHDTSHFSHKSLQTNPHPSTNTPSPSTNISTQQSVTSDQQWDVNDDIVDSLSESEDYLLSFACDDELLHEEREEGGGVEITSGSEQTTQVMNSVTSQLVTQTAGIRREGGNNRNDVTKLTSSSQPSTSDSVLNTSPCSSQGAPDVIEIVPSPPMGASTTVGTLSKPSKSAPFKPPFSRQCCDSVQPSQSAMPDNGAEFQGTYPHTQEMMKIFTQVFGLQRFRPKQLEAVNASLLGADCFILMPTGGGKSLCYQLPALMSAGVTIVVSPLRSLIQDQVQKLCSLEIPARYLSSDLSLTEESAVYSSLVLRDPTTKLLYVTPEKLSASNKLLSTLRNLYNRNKLSRFVIDEAHCISQWGHDFRPDYKRLSELRQNYPMVPIMALTATATPRVRADILHQLNMNQTKWFTQSFNRTNLQYSVVPKKPKKIAEDVISLIKSSFKDQSGIIYCLSRRDCEVMEGELQKAGIAALCYHAGLSDGERSSVQQRWVQEDRCKVVCATIAFGMGIDKPDVRFVFHHSLPKSIEGYYQEAGRAGRDGLPAKCFLFYNYSDMGRLRRMIKAEKMSWEQERTHLDNLYRMVQYCENEADCRRVQVLAYFAEQFDASECRKGSTPCDNCRSHVPFHVEDVTGLVKVIVQSIQSIRRDQFTLVQISEAIKGSSATRIKSSELGSLPLYNRAGRLSKHDLERLLHTLVMKDILSESLHIGNHDNVICYVKTGSKAKDVLSGKSGKVTLCVRGKAQAPSATKDSSKTQSKEDKIKESCYKALLGVRIRVARQFQMNNPESVFSTETLREMSQNLPTTREQLLRVVGVTAVKLKNLNDGKDFLEVTQNFASELSISDTHSPYWIERGRDNSNPSTRGKREKRKNQSRAGAPKAKKPAVVNRTSSENSGDEFEPVSLTSQPCRPGFLPPPKPCTK